MLRELKNVMQIDGEPSRRWFTARGFDLIVWTDANNSFVGFQVCYPLGRETKALTWHVKRGFTHRTVDMGENGACGHTMTPILVPDGVCQRQTVLDVLAKSKSYMDTEVRKFVRTKVMEFNPAA